MARVKIDFKLPYAILRPIELVRPVSYLVYTKNFGWEFQINIDGWPCGDVRNTWISALKNHVFRHLDITKPIDHQNSDKL
jgi:hypothetical protein